MAFPVIALAAGLAKFIPSIVDHLAGDKAGKVAEKAVDIVQTVTGIEDPERAMKKLEVDPKAQLDLQKQFYEYEVSIFKEETKRLGIVNSTMKAEYKANDPYVRRWRPTFGYCVAFSWFILFLSVAYTIIQNPSNAAEIINALISLTTLFSVALGVLGVSVYQRSQDKKIALK